MTQAVSCSWHTDRPAEWLCKRCHKMYGSCCSPRNPTAENNLCALCRQELTYLGGSYGTKPFWQRLNDFFGYPFQKQVLLFLAIIAVLSIAISSGPVTGIVTGVILAAILTKYTFRIIEDMSEGRWQGPSVTEAFTGGGFSLFFKQIVILIAMLGGVGFAMNIGGMVIGIAAIAIFTLSVPGTTMVLARENSFRAAVNPVNVMQLMLAIGWPYLLLCFFLMLLYGAPGLLLSYFNEQISSYILVPTSLVVSSYFYCVMSALMGYCLFQYQSVLGYTADSDENSVPALDEQNYRYQKALADSAILFQEGRAQQAIEVLKPLAAERKQDIELHRRIFEIMAIENDHERLSRQADRYLEILCARQQTAQAAEVFLEMKKRNKEWAPAKPETSHAIARGLWSKRQFKLIVMLLKGLHSRFPHYPKVAEAYLLMAKALSEGLRADGQAIKVLQFVLRQYPDSPAVGEARQLLQVLTPTIVS